MRVSLVRDRIKDKLSDIDGLRAYDVWPDLPNLPAAIVSGQRAEYHHSMGTVGHTLFVFEIVILAASAQAGFARGQDALDPYLDDQGEQSIKAAVEVDPTLGGITSAVVITEWRDYGVMEVGGQEYVGARLELEVYS